MKTKQEIYNILVEYDKRNKIGWTIGETMGAAQHCFVKQSKETDWNDDNQIQELLMS